MTDNHLSELRFDTLELARFDTGRHPLMPASSSATPIQASTLPIALKNGLDVAGSGPDRNGQDGRIPDRRFSAHPDPFGRSSRRTTTVRGSHGHLCSHRPVNWQSRLPRMRKLGKHTGLKISLAYGGTGYEQQRREHAGRRRRSADRHAGTHNRLLQAGRIQAQPRAGRHPG